MSSSPVTRDAPAHEALARPRLTALARRRLGRVAPIGAAASGGLAVLALVGWLTPARVLASLHPAFIPMAPSTAVGFVLLVAAVLAPTGRWQQWVRICTGAVVFAGAVVEFVEAVTGRWRTFDVWLIPSPDLFGLTPVGRMSPLTAVGFMLASTSLLTLGLPFHARKGDIAGLLGSLSGVGSLVLILGYIYGTPLLYGGNVVPVALTTAVAFAGISASLIALGGERHFPLRPLIGDGSRARLLRAFLPLAPAVVIAEGLFFRLVPATNPALHAALLSLLLAVVVSLGVTRSARTVARALDEIEDERWRRGQAERETREKALVLVESQRVARIGSYRADIITGTWTGSAMLYEIFGVDDPPSIGTIQDWLSVIHPDDRGDMEAYFNNEVVGQCKPFEREYRIRRPNDHEVRWVRGLGELLLDEAGRPVELVGTIQDITENKAVETRLRQSQKLEGIGRLAGGVAHDFNNLLAVITGYTELAEKHLASADPARARLEQVRAAVERATRLARQLLAFSRKQVMRLDVLDLNSALRELTQMLERVVGEDVEVQLHPGSELGAVRADPTQIDQVVMNLVLNARDAMPAGGRLTIETANVELDDTYADSHPPTQPGRYVMLAVSDTGSGMDDETLKHLFEPFFTTKPVGEGTGLGLATVYGIVKQSAGYIWVYSEKGRGTTFKIYLPRVDEALTGAARMVAPGPAVGGNETLLVVEDSQALREMVREALEDRGYTVLVAPDGEAAVATAGSFPAPIHMLLTDLVMPRMGGPELAWNLAATRPGIRVLYMSGYAATAVSREGALPSGVSVLEKPFSGNDLARAVRQALDRREHSR